MFLIYSVMSPNNKNAEDAVIDVLLEKLRDIVINKSQESADSLRSITAKIHGRLTSSGKFCFFFVLSLLKHQRIIYFDTKTNYRTKVNNEKHRKENRKKGKK